MSLFPTEIYVHVLKRVRSVKAWGRLQQVSRSFNAIVRDQCWVQVKELEVNMPRLRLNGESIFIFDHDKLLLFVEELGRKARKIRSVSLEAGEPSSQPLINNLMDRLALSEIELEELLLGRDLPTDKLPSLAKFINSVSGSLKSLEISSCSLTFQFLWKSLEISSCPPDSERQLHGAFRNCLALETIAIGSYVSSKSMTRSIIQGKGQLKSLTARSLDASDCSILFDQIEVPLSHCEFQRELFDFDAYMQEVQAQNLVADHPLNSLKSLTLLETVVTPFQLFPDLERLNLIYPSYDVGYKFVNYKIAGFLEHYKNAPGGRRFLTMDVWKLRSELRGRRLALVELVGLIECPVDWAEQQLHCQVLNFLKGNASAKLIIKGYC